MPNELTIPLRISNPKSSKPSSKCPEKRSNGSTESYGERNGQAFLGSTNLVQRNHVRSKEIPKHGL